MPTKLLITAVTGFGLGVAWRTVTMVPMPTALWLLLLSLVIAGWWRYKRSAFAWVPLLASVLLLFCALGVLRTEIAAWQFGNSPLEEQLGETVTVTGTVTREPDVRAKHAQLYITTDTDTLLVTTDRHSQVAYGDLVTARGQLERPTTFTTEYGRTFDYAGYLRARGVEYRVSFAAIKTVAHGEGNEVVSMLLGIKQAFMAGIDRSILEPAAGLGKGLLLGVQAALGDNIEQDFRRTGIIHIVVLSGYNVMLVVAFILFIFSLVLPLRWRLCAAVLAIAAFALIVGLSATVVRASIMASLVLLAQATGRRYDVLRALLVAGLIMLLINPYLLLYDIGFQLSFMATLGLVLFVPSFEATVANQPKRVGWRDFFVATLVTQIAVLPLLMYHIGEVSLIAVVVNVLVLPMVPLAMLLTFVTGTIGLMSSSLAMPVAFLATLSLEYILLLAHWFASLPFAAVIVPPVSPLVVFLMYFGLLLAWYLYHRRTTTTDAFADWTIEVEWDTKSAGAQTVISDNREPAQEIPVFFR